MSGRAHIAARAAICLAGGAWPRGAAGASLASCCFSSFTVRGAVTEAEWQVPLRQRKGGPDTPMETTVTALSPPGDQQGSNNRAAETQA